MDKRKSDKYPDKIHGAPRFGEVDAEAVLGYIEEESKEGRKRKWPSLRKRKESDHGDVSVAETEESDLKYDPEQHGWRLWTRHEHELRIGGVQPDLSRSSLDIPIISEVTLSTENLQSLRDTSGTSKTSLQSDPHEKTLAVHIVHEMEEYRRKKIGSKRNYGPPLP